MKKTSSASTVSRSSMPRWIAPMLATLSDQPFSSAEWVVEPKLDGIRCLAFVRNGRVELYSRNHLLQNEAYPEIAKAIGASVRGDAIVDGEVVAFDPTAKSITSFSTLQQRMGKRGAAALRTGISVYYYVFDLLWWNGRSLLSRPLKERQSHLLEAVRFRDPIRAVEQTSGDGLAQYQNACQRGFEGVIAKRADAPYTPGRSPEWLKFKCVNEQEFVIGGFSDPERSREHFGALLIGYFERGQLRYAGKVGTGYSQATLRSLGTTLRALEQNNCPFVDHHESKRGVHWVAPSLVAQIRFMEWTVDGKIRHPSFLGLRTDKVALDVGRERASAGRAA